MCLGEVLGRLTNPGGSRQPQPETPSPVGSESAVSSKPVGEPKVEEKKTNPKTNPSPAQRNSSSSSISDTGINY